MDHLKVTQGNITRHRAAPRRFAPQYQKVRTRLDPQQHRDFGNSRTWADCHGVTPVVIGAINPQPKPLPGLAPFQRATLDDETIDAIGEVAYKRCRPQASVHGEPTWRRAMARVLVKRALQALRSDEDVPAEGT